MVQALAREQPIVYRRHPEGISPGANILASVALASGAWCWLHGSDDRIAPGAIDAVLERVARDDGIAGVSFARAGFAGEPGREHESLPDPDLLLPDDRDRPHRWADPSEALAQTGLIHTHLSTLVFRRAAWAASLARDPRAPLRIAPHYPHVHLVGRMLVDGAGAWAWEPRRIVRSRFDDQAIEYYDGHVRTANSVGLPRELATIWRALLGPRDPAVRRLVERMHAMWGVPQARRQKHARDGSVLMDLRLLGMARIYWRLPRFWTRTVPYLLVPSPVARAARALLYRVPPMRALPAGDHARVRVEAPAAAEAGQEIVVRIAIEALGPALRTARPHPVWLTTSWDDGPPEQLGLPHAVRRRPETIDVRVGVPWTPGRHVLAVALRQAGTGPLAAAERHVDVLPWPG